MRRPQVNTRLVRTEICMKATQQMTALFITQPTGQQRTHTLRRRTPADHHRTILTKGIIQATSHQTVTILGPSGITKRDDMPLNCCRPTTLDTGYNRETANSWEFRPKASKHGRTAKLRSA